MKSVEKYNKILTNKNYSKREGIQQAIIKL